MEKNKILAASRKGKQNQDLYELEISNKSLKYALISFIAVGLFMYTFYYDKLGYEITFDYSMIIYCSAIIAHAYRSLKQKKKWHIINFISFLILTIINTILFFRWYNGN